MKNGAITSTATITTNAICSARLPAWLTGAVMAETAGTPSTAAISDPPSEQAGRAHQQHQRHDDEDHGVGALGKKNLGKPSVVPEPKPGTIAALVRAIPPITNPANPTIM